MPAPERKGHAQIVLRIKRENADEYDEYKLIPHQQRTGVKLYKLTKEGSTEPYITGYNKEAGGHTCDCPDQQKNRPKGGCKHIKALKAFWIIF